MLWTSWSVVKTLPVLIRLGTKSTLRHQPHLVGDEAESTENSGIRRPRSPVRGLHRWNSRHGLPHGGMRGGPDRPDATVEVSPSTGSSLLSLLRQSQPLQAFDHRLFEGALEATRVCPTAASRQCPVTVMTPQSVITLVDAHQPWARKSRASRELSSEADR